MTELTYDCRNRLVKAGDTTYEYDAENDRIAVETSEYREEYITDSSEELSKVLVITKYWKSDGAEQIIFCYYGNGLVYEKTDDELLIYHFNNIGSTTCLTNKLGEVVERYDYGIYGELLSGDITLTPFIYNGPYGVMNDTNGLYYMRARYYNPEIKRFINQDVVNGDITNSQSLNKYCYVQGNPISLIDPFGLSPLDKLSELGHTVLDVIGYIPVVGDFADAVNAVWYFAEGNWEMAAMSAVSLVLFGNILAKTGKFLVKGGKKAVKFAKNIGRSIDVIAHATSFVSKSSKVITRGVKLGGNLIKKGVGFIGSKASKGMDNIGSRLSKNIDETDVASIMKRADTKVHSGPLKLDLQYFASKSGSSSITGENSRILSDNLAREGRAVGEGEAAAHIVASTGTKRQWASAADSRAVLTKYDIDINDAANGIPLGHPRPHNLTHNRAFHEMVNARLHTVETNMLNNGYGGKAIRSALRRELRSIGKEFENAIRN